jgi:uncharacterized protein (DUF952 family)
MKTILHITTRAEWQAAQRKGVYEAPSLASEGFIHCSTVGQVTETANIFFPGAKDLVLLVIEESAVTAPVKYEPPAGVGSPNREGLFPHVYGPLDLQAVIRVVDFPANDGGTFRLPDGIV